ncbi:hypothetical protein BER92_09350 [Xanthomonas fragariae]|nr:hypothetical protein BER92_09350 [Xanthomonas fragariae]
MLCQPLSSDQSQRGNHADADKTQHIGKMPIRTSLLRFLDPDCPFPAILYNRHSLVSLQP